MKNLIMAVFAALLMVGSLTASANPRAKHSGGMGSCCKTANCCPANMSCCKGNGNCCNGSTSCVCHPKPDGSCVCELGAKQVSGKVAQVGKDKKACGTGASCCKKHS